MRKANLLLPLLLTACGSLPVAPVGPPPPANLAAAATPRAYSAREAVETVVAALSRQAAGGGLARQDLPLRFRASENNAVDWLPQGEAFARQMADIERARRFVIVHNFIISDTITGRRMAGALVAAARRGVRVALTYDTFGTSVYGGGADKIVREMREAGVQVAANSLLKFQRMEHQKIALIDSESGPIYYTGGQGWDDKYSGWGAVPAWNDGAFRVLGDAATQQLCFELWQLAERGVAVVPPGLDGSRAAEHLMRTYFGGGGGSPGRKRVTPLNNLTWDMRPVSDELYRRIDDPGVREIRVAMPYVTDPVALSKLRAAVRRNVSVLFLIPGKSDAEPSQIVTVDAAAGMAREAGPHTAVQVRSWETPETGPAMAHQKFVVFIRSRAGSGRVLDGAVVGGSHNLTAVEGRSGEENNDILVEDAEFAGRMSGLFDRQFQQSAVVPLPGVAMAGIAKIVGTLLRPVM
ncbi:MAG: phosphatidylserine/phosphatidylglycerophosphate/cardiolipin synthase family protein [Candidatus Sericytochromatia bacterium]|nr:phosphatidylserine/phosphatidylglycerophosphate/cardiolipin synthase family protein [Candidatus Tanganyikabacteria bacterium]